MINGYQTFSSVRDEWDLHLNATKRFMRYSLSPEVARLFDTVSSFAGESDHPLLQIQYDAKLRDAALLISGSNSEASGSEAAAMGWLHEIVQTRSSSNLCRAWSYYLLGSVALKKARDRGDLHRLWDAELGHTSSTPYIVDARISFSKALLLLGSSCDILKRNVQRCQALVTGPGIETNTDGTETFRLINASVGSSVRMQMMRSMRGSDERELSGETTKVSSLDEIFEALERDPSDANATNSTNWFLEQLGNFAPPGWRFITAALCPTGELLLTSLEHNDSGENLCHRSACVFPESDQASGPSSCHDFFDLIVKPLNEIVQRSQEQLSGKDCVSDDGDETKKVERARQWWSRRMQIDTDLQELLATVERRLLSSETAKEILLGCSRDDEGLTDNDESVTMSCGSLACRFEAASEVDDGVRKFSETDPPSTKKVGLRDELEESCGLEARFSPEMKKTGLQQERDRREEAIRDTIQKDDSPRRLQSKRNSEHACIFLILDENLQRFPFEGMQCFEGRAICRLPSLSFALAKLVESDANGQALPSFNPERTSFILDPESNLSETKERLLPFLDSFHKKYGACWKSVVGEMPSSEFMEKGLSSNDGLLLYFGHGGGQQYFSREMIEALGQRRGRALSSVILMGCSSGKLESVNTKDSTSRAKLPIHFEPEGVALSYLVAGAPCVVGNLWDVTDRDIDRYVMTFLDSVFDDDGNTSVAHSVADARAACKMRYIIGCAPVCYGLPIKMQSR